MTRQGRKQTATINIDPKNILTSCIMLDHINVRHAGMFFKGTKTKKTGATKWQVSLDVNTTI